MSEYIHPLIAGIVRELPKPGEPMADARRKQWMRAFEGIAVSESGANNA